MAHSYINTSIPHPVVRVKGLVAEIHTIAENVSFTFKVGGNAKVIQASKYGWGNTYVSAPTYNQMMRQVYAIASENKSK
jgi:hypothetical protein